MILQKEYMDEIKEYIENLPDAEFQKNGLEKTQVLQNRDLMEQLWTIYQKEVEDYDCDKDFAKPDAVHEVLGICLSTPTDLVINDEETIVFRITNIYHSQCDIIADGNCREVYKKMAIKGINSFNGLIIAMQDIKEQVEMMGNKATFIID